MLTTHDWARSLGISTDLMAPSVEGYNEPCPLTARQVAIRAIILQGVVAVASDVDPEPVVEWFRNQGVWDYVTPLERSFLADPSSAGQGQRSRFSWQAEAEWALLWVVRKVEALGLPTSQCDSRRLGDEIIPALGSDIEPFLASAEIRPPGLLLAEDDRAYNLWCFMHSASRNGTPVPDDLIQGVLWQRVCAFEWLHGITPWDDVRGDA
jgi:hypothetical protein